MVKTADKRNDNENSSIKKRLFAALCMLLVSLIMLISSSYAWFTLSTAPEVSNIATTVTGNGSLELALMPTTGMLVDISSNGKSSVNAGGANPVDLANIAWGNIVDLTDTTYGLTNVTLYPATLNEGDNFANVPLKTPTFGFDGRAEELKDNTALKSWDKDKTKFDTAKYGVRAIVVSDDFKTDKTETASTLTNDTTFGYVIDFAVRTNAVKDGGEAKLLLTDAQQRIYNSTDASTNTATQGLGSIMTFSNANAAPNIEKLMKAIRITFVENYGNGVAGTTTTVLGTARLTDIVKDVENNTASSNVRFVDAGGNALAVQELTTLKKNTAKQISAIVWLDGDNITNADISAAAHLNGTLNLQFATDITLVPADNAMLNTK